jgi:Cu+-exporting ATPase
METKGVKTMANPVTIGEAAKLTGLSTKMIRHYEASGLIKGTNRTQAGYRLYNTQQLQLLGMIRQARKLGFPIAQIKSLLSLWQNPERASREVKRLAEHHLAEIKEKIEELQHMQSTLVKLADCCNGDDRAHCAILDGLTLHLK